MNLHFLHRRFVGEEERGGELKPFVRRCFKCRSEYNIHHPKNDGVCFACWLGW